jgi:hypothetical protein
MDGLVLDSRRIVSNPATGERFMQEDQLPASPNSSGPGRPRIEDIRDRELVRQSRHRWRERFEGLFKFFGIGTQPLILDWLPDEPDIGGEG